MKYLTLVLIFSTLLQNSASAETAFEILADAYRKATEPATYEDFKPESFNNYNHTAGSVSTLTCKAATADDPDEVGEMMFAIRKPEFAELLSPAKPAHTIPAVPAYDSYPNGPLLPPVVHHAEIPAKTVPAYDDVWAGKIVLGHPKLISLLSSYPNSQAKDYWNLFRSTTSNRDMIIYIPKNNLGIFSDIGNDITFFIRKSNSGVVFIARRGEEEKRIISGYCY